MRRILLTIAISTTALTLTACGSSFESQTYSKAPKRITDELIAQGLSHDEVATLMAENPHARVRPLNSDTYELKGISKLQILEISPSALIEENKFMKIKSSSQPTRKELYNQVLQSNISEEFAPESCTEDSLMRVPEIQISNPTSITNNFEAHQELKLSPSSFNRGITAWYILSPNGSKLNIMFESSPNLTFTPDMPGSYGVALFYKRNGRCNLRVAEITVTENTPYQPELARVEKNFLQKLSSTTLQQVILTNADRAQELLTKQNEIVVAVLDSGVNYNSALLKENMWVNSGEIPGDGIDNDSNGYIDDSVGYDFENDDAHPMDDVGHGSHVAGLVSGKFTGSAGLNKQIKIMALKGGSGAGLDLGSIIKGIDYAVDNGAHIINMSFGGTEPSELIKRSIARAHHHGVLVIAASGNGDHTGRGVDNDVVPQYPASYKLPNVLSVGASEEDGSLTRYSNYGASEVDIVAPGGYATRQEREAKMLYSAYLPNPTGIVLNPMSGTSMATPVVAGIAALILSEQPNLAPDQVRALLMNTGKKSSALRGRIASESVIDAENALLSLQAIN